MTFTKYVGQEGDVITLPCQTQSFVFESPKQLSQFMQDLSKHLSPIQLEDFINKIDPRSN